jgi:hypothetical protein
MKRSTTLLIALSLFCVDRSWASRFDFEPDRVCSITILTQKNGATVVVKITNRAKGEDNVVFEERLRKKGKNVYVSPKGTTFALKRLSEAVTGEENPNYDSGDWEMRVTGSGEEFESFKNTGCAGDVTGTEIIFHGRKTK